MKKNILHIGFLTLAAACALQMTGKPAKQGILTLPTADGSEIRVRLTGDEYYHQYLTEDGYPLTEVNGNFYYSDIDANGNVINSGIKASSVSDRDAATLQFLSKIDMSGLEQRIQKRAANSPMRKSLEQVARQANIVKAPAREADGNDGPPYERGYGLFPDERFPAYGDQKAIVILVEYTDVKFNTSYDPSDYFTRMLNEDGFSDYGGTGSAAEFFRLNSGNSFRPEFDVYGPLTLAHNQAYYGGNDAWGDDKNPGAMVKEACDMLDDIVDFNDYDRNNDGIVDNVFIFYAGRGEASGGGSNTVWPHSWNMTSAGFSNLYYDGVKVHTYGCSNEWEGSRPDGVGTFVHEFSHVMGLPDLYATSYTSSFTPGSWSALDYGPYNNNGCTPPLYGAFERYALGWLKPREINSAVSATLEPISDNVCGVIRSSKDTEFFLVENRQKEGWDAYIPGHGMLIWHVDYNSSVWTSNKVNNTPSHQYCDIEEADGTQTESSRAGDAFPGTANVTSFTSSTTPAMKTWTNQALNYPLTNIREENGIIYFDILGGGTSDIPTPVTYEGSDITPSSVTLSWEPKDGYDCILNVFKTEPVPTDDSAQGDGRTYVTGYKNRNMGQQSQVTIDGLEEETEYAFTVAYSSGWETSEPSDPKTVYTGRRTLDYYRVQVLPATNVTSDSFTACWNTLDDATDYLVTFYELKPDGNFEDGCDFSNFKDGKGLPTGWSTTAGSTYGMGSYSGQAVPSLRMAAGNSLTTATYDDDVKALSFWHRGNNTETGDELKVYATTADGKELVQTVMVDKTVGGTVTEINEFPEGTTSVTIEYVRKGSTGSCALDDVTVYHGVDYVPSQIEELTDLSTGGETSYMVNNLKPSTAYGYTVLATDGELVSLKSDMMQVVTSTGSGVSQMAATDAFALSYSGLDIVSTSAEEIVVTDGTGCVVARGYYRVTLPRAGLYIVTVPSRNYAKKLITQ